MRNEEKRVRRLTTKFEKRSGLDWIGRIRTPVVMIPTVPIRRASSRTNPKGANEAMAG